MQNIVCVCLTKSNKFPLTFSHSLTLPLRCTFINVQEKFFFLLGIESIRSSHSFVLPVFIHYSTDQLAVYKDYINRRELLIPPFLSLSLSVDLFRPTIERVYVSRKGNC